MTIEDRLADWRQTLEQLNGQVIHLHHRREVFHATVDLVQATPSNDGVFAQFLAGLYADAQVLAIRRLVDEDTRTVSFRRLLGQLMEHRRDFTIDWYVRQRVADGDDARWDERDAREVMAAYVDKPHRQHMGGRRLMADKKALTDITERLTSYANEHVAHTDSDPTAVEVTFNELDAAIVHIGELLSQYTLLLRGVGLIQATPVIQSNWTQPLREIGDLPRPWGGGRRGTGGGE